MRHANNAVIMQTKQLGWIETLEEKLHALEGCNQDLEHKLAKQDHVITNLVGDNLKHLQDNMRLTAHINSTSTQLTQIEEQLGQVRAVMLGMVEGMMAGLSLLEAKTSGASGDNQGNQGGDKDSRDTGASLEGSMRVESPLPQEGGLIAEMEREATEAGAGGWFNGMPQGEPESWSGPNSNTSASQDQVRTTLLTTIGSRTLPNLVRFPDNIAQPVVLRSLMEGPIRPWQCLVWAKGSPPPYSQHTPPLHTSGPSHILLQVGPYYEDINGEYWGSGTVEEGENEGGGASIE